MGTRHPLLSGLLISAILTAPVPMAWAGGLAGHGARFELIKGKPAMGYKEVYETNLFLSPPSFNVTGPSRRLGTTCWNTTYDYCEMGLFLGNGCYCVDGMPANTYSVLVNQPLFFVPPKVAHNVYIPASGKTTLNVDFGIDYSTYFQTDWTTQSSTSWYQTFVATGTGIRGVAFRYKAGSAPYVIVNILEDNGDPDIRQWKLVGSGTDTTVNDNTDNWVRFRYGQVRTIPERRYAVQLAAGGSIQPFKRVKDFDSYPSGKAYDANGVPQNFDLNITVFSDNDGTIVTMNQRVQGLANLVDGYFATKWGQTFIAHSTSLAAVDVFAAGANDKWDLDFTWKVYAADANGPIGDQIGPTKVTKAASQAHGAGLHGVSYNPGDVPLVPGNSYFVEFEAQTPPPESPGFNPYPMNNDSYDDGMGYQWTGLAWQPHPEMDVDMTVLEYKLIAPAILVNPIVIPKTVYLGGGQAGPDTFTVTNSGNGTLHYTIEETTEWLSLSSTGGVSTGQADPVTITYATDNLPVGHYTGVITITSPDADSSPQTVTVKLNLATVPSDFDHDTDVDLSDFGHLQACFTGSGNPQTDPACQDAKLDGDDDVDQNDLALFLACLGGPEIRANPACAPAP